MLEADRALLHIEHWMASCEFIQITAGIVRDAAHGAISYQMRVYDAALWATAKSSGIPVIVTEDMQSRPRIESVRYVNPFADDFAMSDVGL